MTHEHPSGHEAWNELPNIQPRQLDWRRAHAELTRLAKCRARLDWEEGGFLLDALRSGAHLHLGFGSFGEYIERILGYSRRTTDERLRVAEALERLPELAQALRAGRVSWSVVRELTRVATPENERAWLGVAQGRTVRQIEELVAGHRPGDGPDDGYDLSLKRRVLRFEVSAETFATVGEAMAKLRRDADSRLDDDAALLLLARQTLGGPSEPGRASYQIGLTVCEACGRGWQHGRGELVEVGSDVVEMADCDAQCLGRIDPQPESAGRSGECDREGAVGQLDECDSDGTMRQSGECDHATAIDTRDRQGRGMTRIVDVHEPRPGGALGQPESAAHVGVRAKRARQDVPPAVRRLVMRRDQGRCVVPGCRQSAFLDLHHVVPRSEGGDHDPDTLVVFCGAHHRALHRGQLTLEGRIATGLVFRHADGTAYGNAVHPREAAICEEVFRALRSLGFRESEARRGLERVRATAHVGDANVPTILREVLALLGATATGNRSRDSRSSPLGDRGQTCV